MKTEELFATTIEDIVKIAKAAVKEIKLMQDMNMNSRYLQEIEDELINMRMVLKMFITTPTKDNLKVLVNHKNYFTRSTKKIERFFDQNYDELPRKFTDAREDGSNFRGMCTAVIDNTISDAEDVLKLLGG